ncbi:MAG: hypothetical protein EOO05_11370 [Chitinophagaceae bacterium]|nr:MAG: hypothetical protein EOO05_11370 [Chitinophagaceae bacterium]
MKKIKQHKLRLLLFQSLAAFVICFSLSFYRAVSQAPDPDDRRTNLVAAGQHPAPATSDAGDELQFHNVAYVEGNEFLGMDSVHVVNSIREFLGWYRNNQQKANSFRFLGKDREGYYCLDTAAVSGYLSFLKQSGYFSASYLNIWKVFFNDRAVSLREEKMKEDQPEGFDLDLVLITQEPELITDHIGELKWKMISMNRDVVLVSCVSPGNQGLAYEFEMYRNDRSWLIGYISTPNFD